MWPSSSWVQPACCENHNLFLRHEKEKRPSSSNDINSWALDPPLLGVVPLGLGVLSSLMGVVIQNSPLPHDHDQSPSPRHQRGGSQCFCWGHLCQFLVESHLTLIGVWGLNLGSRLFEVRMIPNSWPMFCSDGFMVTAEIIYIGCNV